MAYADFEQQRLRVYEDLSGVLKGKVFADPVHLELFATDAGCFRVVPLVVVRPQNTADVLSCVQYCAEQRLPVHARGAGTGVVGGSLGPGVVIDFSPYLRRIVVERDGLLLRCQLGAVLDRAQTVLAPLQRRLAPGLGHTSVSTLGGVLNRCGRGQQSLRYGTLRDWVREVTVCLADGTRLHLGQERLADYAGAPAFSPKARLVQQVGQLLQELPEEAVQKGKTPVAGGYRLTDVLQDGCVDFPKLLAGSEGTLGLLLEVTLETFPAAPASSLALLLFRQLDAGFAAALEVLPFRPSVCDLMDRRHLGLAREADGRLEAVIPEYMEAGLLLEFEGSSESEARANLEDVVDLLRMRLGFKFVSRWAFNVEESGLLWGLSSIPQPTNQAGERRSWPLPIADDFWFHPERLADGVAMLQAVFRKHGIPASVYCHVGEGHVHVQPFFDLADVHLLRKMHALVEEVYGHTLDCGGGIGGERGCGISRTAFMPRQWGLLYGWFQKLKRVFDPLNILNPGKIVAEEDFPSWWELLQTPAGRSVQTKTGFASDGTHEQDSAHRVDETTAGKAAEIASALLAKASSGRDSAVELEVEASQVSSALDVAEEAAGGQEEDSTFEELPRVLESQLDWQPDILARAVNRCTLCGECRTQVAPWRMCPMFRVHPAEESSPRAKANLMRAVLDQHLPLETLTSSELRQIADLCVHCHTCRVECSTRVDIPCLVMETKAAYVAAHGIDFSNWVLNRLESFAAWGARIAPIVNWALANRQTRWLLEKMTGISQVRKLPRIHAVSFIQRAAGRRLHRPSEQGGNKVVYFVDLYANWFDPQLAEVFVAILRRNGIGVYVPLQQRWAGTPAIASGELGYARRLARRNVAILAEAIRQGHEVVVTEPAAAVTLKQEYPQLLEDEDAQLVARHTHEAGEYLRDLYDAGALRCEFEEIPLSLAYHWPCRLKALEVGKPAIDLLSLVPGLQITELPNCCSGMAGTFGLKDVNLRTSLRIGWPMISALRETKCQASLTECSVCRIQLEQGTAPVAVHPVKVLAAAYGLLRGGWQSLLQQSGRGSCKIGDVK